MNFEQMNVSLIHHKLHYHPSTHSLYCRQTITPRKCALQVQRAIPVSSARNPVLRYSHEAPIPRRPSSACYNLFKFTRLAHKPVKGASCLSFRESQLFNKIGAESDIYQWVHVDRICAMWFEARKKSWRIRRYG